MSITTAIDHYKKLATHIVTGETSFDEIMATIRQFWEGRPTKNVLWDFTKANLIHVAYYEAMQIVNYTRPQTEKRIGGKTAFVASKDLENGISREFKALREFHNPPYQLEVFRSVEEANQWLDQEKNLTYL